MYAGSPYLSSARRLRELRYRRTLAGALVAAVALHVVFVLVMAPLRGVIPLVRRSGYRGPVQLLPEISILRDPAEQESEAQSSGDILGGSGFRVVDLLMSDLELVERPATEAEVEEVDTAVGDDITNLRNTSLPQPSGQEIVIEHMVEPEYPPSAIARGVEGVAVFGIAVEPSGNVRQAWLVQSDVTGECNLSAQRALLQWRFEPYLVDGQPAPFMKYYRVRFELTDDLLEARREAARTAGRRPRP